MLTEEKQKALLAVKKSLGTIIKIIDYIEKDEYCPRIIQQIEAVEGLLSSSRKHLLRGHLSHCLEHTLKENKEKAISELIKILDLK